MEGVMLKAFPYILLENHVKFDYAAQHSTSSLVHLHIATGPNSNVAQVNNCHSLYNQLAQVVWGSMSLVCQFGLRIVD